MVKKRRKTRQYLKYKRTSRIGKTQKTKLGKKNRSKLSIDDSGDIIDDLSIHKNTLENTKLLSNIRESMVEVTGRIKNFLKTSPKLPEIIEKTEEKVQDLQNLASVRSERPKIIKFKKISRPTYENEKRSSIYKANQSDHTKS